MRRWPIPLLVLTGLGLVLLCGCKAMQERFHRKDESTATTDLEAPIRVSAGTESDETAPSSEEEAAATEESTPAEEQPAEDKDEGAAAEPADDETGSKGPATKVAKKPADAEEPPKATPAPEPEPKAPAIEEVMIKECAPDIAIALAHIRAADEAASAQDVDQARRGIDKAQLALGFAGCEISSVLVRQNCERAITRIAQGDTDAAAEAIQTAVDLAQEVALAGSLRDFRNAAGRAKQNMAAGKGAEAVEQLHRMVKAVQTSPTEESLEVVQEHLLGAEQALDRDVPSVAEAELKGARSRLISLLERLEKGE